MPKLDRRASVATRNLGTRSNGPGGLFGSALATAGKENAGQRHVGVQRTGRLRGRSARGRCGQHVDHRSRSVPGAADPGHLAPPALVGRRGASAADRLCRGAGRRDPGPAADRQRIFADLVRDRRARGRDHHSRPGSACACTNRWALPLGHHPVAGPGAGPIWPGAERIRVCGSSIRRAVATPASSSPGVARAPSSRHPCCRNPGWTAH